MLNCWCAWGHHQIASFNLNLKMLDRWTDLLQEYLALKLSSFLNDCKQVSLHFCLKNKPKSSTTTMLVCWYDVFVSVVKKCFLLPNIGQVMSSTLVSSSHQVIHNNCRLFMCNVLYVRKLLFLPVTLLIVLSIWTFIVPLLGFP